MRKEVMLLIDGPEFRYVFVDSAIGSYCGEPIDVDDALIIWMVRAKAHSYVHAKHRQGAILPPLHPFLSSSIGTPFLLPAASGRRWFPLHFVTTRAGVAPISSRRLREATASPSVAAGVRNPVEGEPSRVQFLFPFSFLSHSFRRRRAHRLRPSS